MSLTLILLFTFSPLLLRLVIRPGRTAAVQPDTALQMIPTAPMTQAVRHVMTFAGEAHRARR
jgi:hypothetical protein